ncbi:MAG TPA: DUF5719 family protein [Mycobacteriales bacterium]|nr:DUF5719 family protein [Mycobacteriales bacterium]
MTRPPLALGAVVLALALGTGAVSAVGTPGPSQGGGRDVEVLGATAVCPDVRQVAGVYQTRVSVGSAPLPAGRTATGGSIVSTVVQDPGPPTTVPIEAPGQVAVGLATRIPRNGVVVSATGALATGLEVEQVARANDGPFRGLAGLRCEAPKRDAWFIGASTRVIDTSMLVLANVDDTPSTVDVTAFGRQAAVDPRPGQGLTVRPHSRLRIPLDVLAPDQDFLAVRVLSRQGRVVAALSDARYVGGKPLGFDYVPQALPPARTVVVPGLPQGPGVRGLLVGNPTDDDTTVSVQVTLNDGQFVPSGMAEIGVAAHRTTLIDLSAVTARSPVTVTVTSSGPPVVAGGYLVEAQQFQPGGIREMAFAGSSSPLSGSALLTDLVINRPTESTLLLSAPADAATVVVTPISVLGVPGSPPRPRTVEIPAGRTVLVRLSTFFPPGTSAQLALEVRPGADSGPVYASRYLRERGGRGPLATLLTLQGPAQLVARPVAVQDDGAGYP